MFNRSRSLERLQLNILGQLTWKSCARLKSKAMEQEFTWSGFVISFSIAFFVVFSASSALNTAYEKSVLLAERNLQPRVYFLEHQLQASSGLVNHSC